MRLAHERVHLACRSTKPPGWRRERMREDVAGLSSGTTSAKMVSGSSRWRPRRAAARAGRSGCTAAGRARGRSPPASFITSTPQRAKPPSSACALKPLTMSRVGQRRLHGGVDVQAVGLVERRVVVAFHAADEIGGQEGEDARLLARSTTNSRKRRQRHARRAALVDQRRHAGMHAAHVGLETEAAGDVLEDVRVRVDQAGQHELAARRRCAASPRRRACGATAAMRPSLHRDVVAAVELLRRVDQVPPRSRMSYAHGVVPPG